MAAEGTEVTVLKLPDCDIHKYDQGKAGVPAAYDAKTKQGPWANMCEDCFPVHAASSTLGTGHGQRLVLKDNG